jgi:hypothetical protein
MALHGSAQAHLGVVRRLDLGEDTLPQLGHDGPGHLGIEPYGLISGHSASLLNRHYRRRGGGGGRSGRVRPAALETGPCYALHGRVVKGRNARGGPGSAADR